MPLNILMNGKMIGINKIDYMYFKEFIKRVSWKKFIKYEFIFTMIISVLYVFSILRGANKFPENSYVLYLLPILFAIMMLLKAHSSLIYEKLPKKE